MAARQRELRGHHRLLGAVAHEAALGAHAQRQAQRVEQDRLAGAGLAGEHAEPGMEGEVEPVDQHDVANGEAEQHRRARDGAWLASRRDDSGADGGRPEAAAGGRSSLEDRAHRAEHAAEEARALALVRAL